MQPDIVYDEVIEFIASSSPQNVIAFRPSEEAKARVADLIFREKTEGLSDDEKSELDHYLQIEHLMRLAKARAHHYLTHGLDGSVTNYARQSPTEQSNYANTVSSPRQTPSTAAKSII